MFVIEVPYINLDKIYNSTQILRWIKLKDQKYIICNGDKAVKVEQVKSRLMIACSEEEFFNEWYWYLNLDGAYDNAFHKMTHMDSKFMKICAVRGNGIRIMKQNLFEAMVTYIIAANMNHTKVKLVIEELTKICGIEHKQSFREAGRRKWYEFPTPQLIIENQDKLMQCKFEFNQNIIIQLAQDIVDGWLDLEELKSMKYNDAKEYLMQFNGIDLNVANCICLYALHHLQVFVTSAYIDKILNREFGLSIDEFVEWYQSDIFNIEGIVQQFILYNELNPSKEEVSLSGISGFNQKRSTRKSNKVSK